MTVESKVGSARKAMAEIGDYTQEQVDNLVYAAAKIIYDNAELLAEEAVAETRLGKVAHKIDKNKDTAAVFYDYLKDKRSVGVINEIPEQGLIEVAHPVGVVAAVIPATNPIITTTGNFLHAVKGKNAIIVTPAPRAEKCITHTIELIRAALAREGAPADLIQVLESPTFEMTGELMKACDLVLATGGWGLTKAAYSSGTPAYGVGPGNAPVILDRDFDIAAAARLSLDSKRSDNGILCDDEEILFYPAETEKELFGALRDIGVVVYEDEADVDKIRQTVFPDGHVDANILGKDAPVLAAAAGLSVPDATELIAVKVVKCGAEDILNDEIMGPVLKLKSYQTFEEAVDMAVGYLMNSGIGHTAGIFSNNRDHIVYAGERIPVSRLLVNQPSTYAWGPITNGLAPAVSEGCGTWAGNILAGNVDYVHLLNISKIAFPLDIEAPTGEQIFAR